MTLGPTMVCHQLSLSIGTKKESHQLLLLTHNLRRGEVFVDQKTISQSAFGPLSYFPSTSLRSNRGDKSCGGKLSPSRKRGRLGATLLNTCLVPPRKPCFLNLLKKTIASGPH